MGKNTGLEKFLNDAEVLFDGNTYKLNVEERQQIQEALEMAFWDAKERNKRKKK
ncbi:XRE family transcriptional regulator [uncultured Megamonas sp.]|uniref:XRE family transcriptional regulator n=1 Tax=uncultured Megamonas sp. TaxID=286140 RepID=UPI0025CD9D9B|nr:XRE family transcriptional regulator [uncultured Megamonas sp.]